MAIPSKHPTRTQQAVRSYLLRNTPKSSKFIPLDGVRGKFSKVTEEYQELKDALTTGNRPLAFLEGCDLVDATLRLQAKEFMVPGFAVMAAVYLRRIYKPLRNRMYEYAGLDKEDFNAAESEPRETNDAKESSVDARARMERVLDASLEQQPIEEAPTISPCTTTPPRAKQRSR